MITGKLIVMVGLINCRVDGGFPVFEIVVVLIWMELRCQGHGLQHSLCICRLKQYQRDVVSLLYRNGRHDLRVIVFVNVVVVFVCVVVVFLVCVFMLKK